jgi:uncharacterized protein
MKVAVFLFVSFLMLTAKVQANPSQKIRLGKFQSRALWTPTVTTKLAPAVILVPGSGANGPEEMMPAQITADGKDHALFNQIAEPFQKAGLHTLALGKPGIEFFTNWSNLYYDENLYRNLHWKDLIENLKQAVLFVKNQPGIDTNRIYILGHSEGTQVAVDYAATDSHIAGLILLGYFGEDVETILDWQLFKREIEHFVATDVDKNHDSFVTRAEAINSPGFQWPWKPGQEKVSYQEIEDLLRKQPNRLAIVNSAKSAPLYSEGFYDRGPVYKKTAALTQDLYVFTGEVDLQTPVREAKTLEAYCASGSKLNCSITIVPGVGHGFSLPRAPRFHPLLDITVGPVTPDFQNMLFNLGQKLLGSP